MCMKKSKTCIINGILCLCVCVCVCRISQTRAHIIMSCSSVDCGGGGAFGRVKFKLLVALAKFSVHLVEEECRCVWRPHGMRYLV